MEKPESLLIVGGPNAGKTVYGTQVLARLRNSSGELKLRTSPENIAPFERALSRLSQGLAPDHTGASTYLELVLPLIGHSGVPIDLIWPDYGGEQIRDILETRHVPDTWLARVRSAAGWMLFVRPDRIRRDDDVISRPPASVLRTRSAPQPSTDDEVRWSDGAALVELLQILLFVRGAGTARRICQPPLTVLLSCWDELPAVSGVRPVDLLRRLAPLLANYLEAVWDSRSLEVIGVSAQGRALSTSQPDEDYVDLGPEHFGYVVLGDGRSTEDLTRPIQVLLERSA